VDFRRKSRKFPNAKESGEGTFQSNGVMAEVNKRGEKKVKKQFPEENLSTKEGEGKRRRRMKEGQNIGGRAAWMNRGRGNQY